jgi:hypothetical protein
VVAKADPMEIRLAEKGVKHNESGHHLLFHPEMSSHSFREMLEAMERVASISMRAEPVLVALLQAVPARLPIVIGM